MPANYDWETFNVRGEKDNVSSSYFQAQPPNPENQTPSAALPPGAAQAVTSGESSLDSYTSTQNQDGVPPTSRPWPNKPPIAIPVEQSLLLINKFDATPPTYGQSPGTSIQYENVLSGVESNNNDDDGVILPEENDKRWAHGFGGLKERNREKETLDELVRLVGRC